jgi:hypothetical protein
MLKRAKAARRHETSALIRKSDFAGWLDIFIGTRMMILRRTFRVRDAPFEGRTIPQRILPIPIGGRTNL